ncbi:Uncharacterised protein [Shewanella baltica]|nr:Uncharacterised protein [Shewanella baltica]
MRLLAIFLIIATVGCSSSLKVIDGTESGEGIVIMSQNGEMILAQVISYPSRSYSFYLKEINKFSGNYCGSNYEVTLRDDMIVVISYECRSGGCGESPNQAYVFEIKCPNK